MQEKIVQSIKGWKEDDRPREKCLAHGIQSLSDAELIAILIGSGTRSKSAVELGREVLRSVGNKLSELSKRNFKELSSINGIGTAKAVILLSAIELGRRRQAEEVVGGTSMVSSRQAAELFKSLLSDLTVEEFWVMMINHSNRCVSKVRISSGGINQTIVDPKVIFREALQHMATGVVLCHNHPSGSYYPSSLDVELTRQIVSGANALDIRVLDHIIVSNEGYFSFADSNML